MKKYILLLSILLLTSCCHFDDSIHVIDEIRLSDGGSYKYIYEFSGILSNLYTDKKYNVGDTLFLTFKRR